MSCSSKGKTKSKQFFQADVSSKKRMNKFYFTTMKPCFFSFLEVEDTKKTFRNQLTFKDTSPRNLVCILTFESTREHEPCQFFLTFCNKQVRLGSEKPRNTTVGWSDYKFYMQMLCFFLYPHLHIKSKTSAYIRHLL